jgi:hypothetical protein
VLLLLVVLPVFFVRSCLGSQLRGGEHPFQTTHPAWGADIFSFSSPPTTNQTFLDEALEDSKRPSLFFFLVLICVWR